MAEELAALDQLVDPDDLLLDDTAGAHVEVAHLRRALIAGPKTDGATGGAEHGVGIIREDAGEDLRMGERDRVSGVVTADAPAVTDDQHDGLLHGRQGLPGTVQAVHVRSARRARTARS
jgi:hypothetical protein